MRIKAVPLPFREQAEFFRRKLNLPTQAWTDIYGREHDWTFVVAGANRDALVADFRAAIEKVITQGGTLEEFRKDFDRIVAEHGWSYNGGRNWRSRIIYETNLNSSYQAGRYQQLLAVREDRPYWQYLHSDAVEDPREEHLAWDGMILRWDDPWWQTHFPINAWGCQCRVIALSDADLQRMGRTVDTAPPLEMETRIIGKRSPGGPRTVEVPKGIDPGFEHIPGLSRLKSAVPPPNPNGIGSAGAPGVPNVTAPDPLPPARSYPPSRVLPAGLNPADYVSRFLEEFNATPQRPAVFQDVIGESLVVGRDLFVDRTTGALKVLKRGREQYLLLLADTLKDPDEIWVRLEWMGTLNKAVVRRRYIARFMVEGQALPAVAVFELGVDGWMGVTTFTAADSGYLEGLRHGVRLYQREPQEP